MYHNLSLKTPPEVGVISKRKMKNGVKKENKTLDLCFAEKRWISKDWVEQNRFLFGSTFLKGGFLKESSNILKN
jgi:hypothetical protein